MVQYYCSITATTDDDDLITTALLTTLDYSMYYYHARTILYSTSTTIPYHHTIPSSCTCCWYCWYHTVSYLLYTTTTLLVVVGWTGRLKVLVGSLLCSTEVLTSMRCSSDACCGIFVHRLMYGGYALPLSNRCAGSSGTYCKLVSKYR
jgi:hypothetical protein